MSNIMTILKTVRPPTKPFVNEDTLPDAINNCPALAHVASSGLRSKEFAEGFISTINSIYDLLDDTELLSKMTIERVTEVDRLMMEDGSTITGVLAELPHISRYMKAKMDPDFKAGALLALVSAALFEQIPEEGSALEQIDTTPTKKAPSIQDETIQDDEPAPASTTEPAEPKLLEAGPTGLTALLLELKVLFPDMQDISMSLMMGDAPCATLNIELAKTVRFDELEGAVSELKKLTNQALLIGTKNEHVTIQIVM